MYLLYLDESGSATDPKSKHFILAGVAFFERSTHWAEQHLNSVVGTLTTGDIHGMELHGSPMYGGKGLWRRVERDVRHSAIKRALEVGVGANRDARVFAAVIERDSCGGLDAVHLAFEELCRRFDLYLAAMHRRGDTQRGIIIFDKCSTENRIQELARSFKYTGHAQGMIRNYAEVPLFLDSKASRLIQLADLVAYAFYRSYEFGDHQFLDVFRHKIHQHAGLQYGLFESLVPPSLPAGDDEASVLASIQIEAVLTSDAAIVSTRADIVSCNSER